MHTDSPQGPAYPELSTAFSAVGCRHARASRNVQRATRVLKQEKRQQEAAKRKAQIKKIRTQTKLALKEAKKKAAEKAVEKFKSSKAFKKLIKQEATKMFTQWKKGHKQTEIKRLSDKLLDHVFSLRKSNMKKKTDESVAASVPVAASVQNGASDRLLEARAASNRCLEALGASPLPPLDYPPKRD